MDKLLHNFQTAPQDMSKQQEPNNQNAHKHQLDDNYSNVGSAFEGQQDQQQKVSVEKIQEQDLAGNILEDDEADWVDDDDEPLNNDDEESRTDSQVEDNEQNSDDQSNSSGEANSNNSEGDQDQSSGKQESEDSDGGFEFEGGRYHGQTKDGLPHGVGLLIHNGIFISQGEWINGKKNGCFAELGFDFRFFEGPYVDGVRQGIGKLRDMKGNKYEGEFNNNQMVGKVKWVMIDGGVYEGDFKDGRFNGYGILIFPDYSYAGNLVENQYHGFGVYTNSQGRYEGMWQFGEQHGWGVETYAQEARFEGWFMNGKKNGYGVFRSSKRFHKGYYLNGMEHGQGLEYDNEGQKVVGQWHEQVSTGELTVFYNNHLAWYTGSYQNNRRNGYGCLTCQNNHFTKGYFNNGQKWGQGIFIDDCTYTGDFIHDKNHGIGTYICPKDHIYSGDWDQGVKQGQGSLCMEDGLAVEGLFLRGHAARITILQIPFRVQQEDVIKSQNDNEESGSEDGDQQIKSEIIIVTKTMTSKVKIMKMIAATMILTRVTVVVGKIKRVKVIRVTTEMTFRMGGLFSG